MSSERPGSSPVSVLKRYRRLWPLLLCLLVGVLLLAFGGGETTGGGEEPTDSARLACERALEAELTELCSSIEGVGKCRVKVTLRSGERTVYQGSREEIVYAPEVGAVTVVCEGAGSERVRGMLTELLAAHLDVGTHRICVLPLKK